ncbi:hypothetical protein QR680_011197 [Steinernema hermaphroditum]|uniref:RING-CH-type domain-containing protein n=1 Tax=Steinernema hermaphroditum TaxID=289476 RepID=A0AA39MCT1_9BILA|nr:hypothetical protein QR680_011197 [Steinernema hermaphroditum]
MEPMDELPPPVGPPVPRTIVVKKMAGDESVAIEMENIGATGKESVRYSPQDPSDGGKVLMEEEFDGNQPEGAVDDGQVQDPALATIPTEEVDCSSPKEIQIELGQEEQKEPDSSEQTTEDTYSVQGPICRICFTDGDLYSPCLCAGSLEHVHQSCLEQWMKTRENVAKTCEICKAKIEFREEEVAELTIPPSAFWKAICMYSAHSTLRLMKYLPLLAIFVVICTFGSSLFWNIFYSVILLLIYLCSATWDHSDDTLNQAHPELYVLPKIGNSYSLKRIRDVKLRCILLLLASQLLIVVIYSGIAVGIFLILPVHDGSAANGTALDSSTDKDGEGVVVRILRTMSHYLQLHWLEAYAAIAFVAATIIKGRLFLNAFGSYVLGFIAKVQMGFVMVFLFNKYTTGFFNGFMLTTDYDNFYLVAQLCGLYIIGYVVFHKFLQSGIRYHTDHTRNQFDKDWLKVPTLFLIVFMNLLIAFIFVIPLIIVTEMGLTPIRFGEPLNVHVNLTFNTTSEEDHFDIPWNGLIESANYAILTYFTLCTAVNFTPICKVILVIRLKVCKRLKIKSRSKLRHKIAIVFGQFLLLAISFPLYIISILAIGRFMVGHSNDLVNIGTSLMIIRLLTSNVDFYLHIVLSQMRAFFFGVPAAALLVVLYQLGILEELHGFYFLLCYLLPMLTVFSGTWITFKRTEEEVRAWVGLWICYFLILLYPAIIAFVADLSYFTPLYGSMYQVAVVVVIRIVYGIWKIPAIYRMLRFEFDEIRTVLVNYKDQKKPDPTMKERIESLDAKLGKIKNITVASLVKDSIGSQWQQWRQATNRARVGNVEGEQIQGEAGKGGEGATHAAV